MTQQYDYIIVGAGSAGCVLAGRLSANPGKQVLLLECGGKNRDFLIGVSKGIGKLVHSPAHCLTYEVGGERLAGQPPEVWIRGKGLGGSSAINGMIWSRCHPQDFDYWEQLGCTGWNWQTMKSAFYVYAVVGVHLFGGVDPGHWGTFPRAGLTLFEILTLEGWVHLMDASLAPTRWAWVYYVSFVVLAVFVVINLFIAIVINNLEAAKREHEPAWRGALSRRVSPACARRSRGSSRPSCARPGGSGARRTA